MCVMQLGLESRCPLFLNAAYFRAGAFAPPPTNSHLLLRSKGRLAHLGWKASAYPCFSCRSLPSSSSDIGQIRRPGANSLSNPP